MPYIIQRDDRLWAVATRREAVDRAASLGETIALPPNGLPAGARREKGGVTVTSVGWIDIERATVPRERAGRVSIDTFDTEAYRKFLLRTFNSLTSFGA